MVAVDALTPSSSGWEESLGLVHHDVYHLPGYVKAEAVRLRGEPVALRVRSRDRMLMLPLILRPLPYGLEGLDAISPYGYPGPLLTSAAHIDDGFVRDAGAAVIEFLRDYGCCTAFVRGHPLMPQSRLLFAGFGRSRSVGKTVWLDLAVSTGERWDRFDPKLRNRLRRNERDGLVVSVDKDWDSLERFAALYRETMGRVGADRSYYFDIDYFASLKRELGNRIHLILARIGGSLVGAGLFTEVGGTVQYHLAGTKLLWGSSPSAGLIYFASVWAADRGNRILHLGGGYGGGVDSLLRFKTRFSPLRGTFHSWEIVLDPEQLEHLIRLSAAEISNDHDKTVNSRDYFPPYRAP